MTGVQTCALPISLSIMDSAMFSRGRMGLSDGEADAAVDRILAIAHAVGGTIVVNWHCRSLAPERLWGRFYQHLLNKLASEKAWFVSAGEAVDWFAWRRSLRFDRPKLEDGRGVVVIAPTAGPRAGVLRVWRPGSTGPEDLRLSGRATTEVCFSELPASAEAS